MDKSILRKRALELFPAAAMVCLWCPNWTIAMATQHETAGSLEFEKHVCSIGAICVCAAAAKPGEKAAQKRGRYGAME